MTIFLPVRFKVHWSVDLLPWFFLDKAFCFSTPSDEANKNRPNPHSRSLIGPILNRQSGAVNLGGGGNLTPSNSRQSFYRPRLSEGVQFLSTFPAVERNPHQNIRGGGRRTSFRSQPQGPRTPSAPRQTTRTARLCLARRCRRPRPGVTRPGPACAPPACRAAPAPPPSCSSAARAARPEIHFTLIGPRPPPQWVWPWIPSPRDLWEALRY